VAYAPDGIVLASDDGRILLGNAAFQQLVEPKLSDASGLSIFDFFAIGAAPEFRAQLAQLTEVGRRLGPFETALHRARAADAQVEFTVGRLPGENGSVLAFNVRDVTERKQLETQLLRSQRIELLGQFAGGIVHDVNNILTAISGNAVLIEDAERERVPIYVENILKSVKRGANLLRQILMFARGADQALAPTSTAGIVIETCGIVGEVLGKKVTVTTDTPADLPEIMGDANQLHQVLMNFCVNARDAMPHGGSIHIATHRVTLSDAEARQIGPLARAGDFVTLSVRDTGTGITPEVKARLFDPFFTTKPPERGSGLGLATVLRVVRRHDGFVSVETEVGAGTRFTCYFPVPASGCRS
jgi:PAS domain S-box-containing protein